MGSERHLNKTCRTVISSAICHPSATSGGVPECLGYKLKCESSTSQEQRLDQAGCLGHGLTEGGGFLLPVLL